MLAFVSIAGCGGGTRSTACTGYDAVVDALRAVESARISDASGDADGVNRAFRATGTVDFSLTQFASRELNRAASGAGGAPLNC
jgi:hypothetical protein